MDHHNDSPVWMQEPSVKNIAKEKLDFLQKLVFESASLTPRQLLPFRMALAQRSRTERISFSQEEMTAIIEAIKKYSTPEEISKVDQILKLMSPKKSG